MTGRARPPGNFVLDEETFAQQPLRMAPPCCQRGPTGKSMSGESVTPWRRLFVGLLGLFLLSGTAAARIGETEAEVEARYGSPIFTLPSKVEASLTKCYLSGGFSIAVTYVGGRSAREMLAKADKSAISDKEIQRLLEANAGGADWNPQQLAGEKNVPDGLLGWRTIDEKPRVALYDGRTQAFFVTTQRFINLTNATSRRSAVKMRGDTTIARGQERLIRTLPRGGLVGRGALPTSSPARKADAGK